MEFWRALQLPIVAIQQIQRLAIELCQQLQRGLTPHGFQTGHGCRAEIIIMGSALDEGSRTRGSHVRGGGGQVIVQISAEVEELLRAAGAWHERRGVENDAVGCVHGDNAVVQPVVQHRAWPDI